VGAVPVFEALCVCVDGLFALPNIVNITMKDKELLLSNDHLLRLPIGKKNFNVQGGENE